MPGSPLTGHPNDGESLSVVERVEKVGARLSNLYIILSWVPSAARCQQLTDAAIDLSEGAPRSRFSTARAKACEDLLLGKS